MKRVKVGIVGASGYAGAELTRLLLTHPQAQIVAISSVSFEGKPLFALYGGFYKQFDQLLENEEAVVDRSEVVFASLPHGLSMDLAKRCIEQGKLFIDLGADFRLEQEKDYNEWYKLEYKYKELNQEAVYGLPELFRDRIKQARIVGNPGCYPTSAALALAPALEMGAIGDDLLIDSKSGVSGAGRALTQETHFPDSNEAFGPYKVATHRHTPELEQTLSKFAGKGITLTFVPHLLPVNRGILSTCYATLKSGVKFESVVSHYRARYSGEPFVRVLPDGAAANIKNVRYSNFCDLSLHHDPRTGRLIVVSAIDNMVKGAAGQAIQNMNLIRDLGETTGLMAIPPSF